MSTKNVYVVDKSDEELDLEELKTFYEQIQENKIAGDIRWHPQQLNDDKETEQLIEKIETHLIDNNERFSRFPNDFVHGQMSYDVYRSDLKELQKAFQEHFKNHQQKKDVEGNPEWIVLKVYNEPNEDSLKCKKGEKYSSAIYYNESKTPVSVFFIFFHTHTFPNNINWGSKRL